MNLVQPLINLVIKSFNSSEVPNTVVIYGAGYNGILLKKYLYSSSMSVDFFCDSDPKKSGNIIENITCISVEQLVQMKNDVIVFVSPYNSEEIMKDLEERGFPYIVSSDLMKIISNLPSSYLADSFKSFPHFGHYYSLYPDLDKIMDNEGDIFDKGKEVHDIDFYENEQISLLRRMVELYPSLPQWESVLNPKTTNKYRYKLDNHSFSAGDAIGLHCMLRILKPKNMIEVGSGFSSAVTLDTNEFYLKNQTKITFIEPYPKLLKSLLKSSDQIDLIEDGLQNIPLNTFDKLDEGDILFIDSTHVSKINSDVNYLFFEILPRLKKGVFIHIHDIFFPFEYPKQWIKDGMIWNELYLLRSFLQNNKSYSIVFFQNMMEQKHMDLFLEKWPLDEQVLRGGSIWIRKDA